MNQSERVLWAVAIVLADLLMVIVPLAAILAAYIMIARPAWFLAFTEKLYKS